MTFEHLSPRSRVVAGQGVSERVAYLRELPYIPIEPMDQVEKWLHEAVVTHVAWPLKPISFLLAPNGMGARSMVGRLVSAFPACPANDQRIAGRSIVVAHIPSKGSLREIGAEVCEFTGAPHHHIGGSSPDTTGWLKLLDRIGTRMLILKDMQALSCLSKSHQGPVLNLVRTATSRYGMQVALIGPPELRPIVMNDSQLADRTQLIEVMPFKASDPALTRFLEAFQHWCPLRRTSDLCDDHGLRKALVRRTGGTARNMLDVLTRLGAFAIYSAEERITYELWRDYFSRAEYA
nr:TniB family NTP-binding protein [Pseudaestuariivita rosea]